MKVGLEGFMTLKIFSATFGATNIDEERKFLLDFGLEINFEQPDRIYFRGTEDRPHILTIKKADKSGPISCAYEVDTEANLRALANKLNATVEPIEDNPWGGLRALLSDCDGNIVELVHGVERVAPLKLPREVVVHNSGGKVRRKGRLPIFSDQPLTVLKLCHVVYASPDTHRFINWYVENLGAYPSDIIMGQKQPTLAFMRFPDGQKWIDHHNVAVFDGAKVAVQHVCFESLDMDAVFMAHAYLKKRGYRRSWGPVRHTYGGGLSDYWHSPAGMRIEHVTDSDIVNHEFDTLITPMSEKATLQWTTEAMPSHYLE
jgi:Glyoxalase/Bleomycin resistance protein/Dioxygenase superfamily